MSDSNPWDALEADVKDSLKGIASSPADKFRKWVEFLKRSKGSYSEPLDQMVFDPRLDSNLAIIRKAAEQAYVPDALPGNTTLTGVVMAVLRYSPVPYSALDPQLNIVPDVDKIDKERFSLKCYIIDAPTTAMFPIKEIYSMNPLYISLLPTFHGHVDQKEEKRPAVGDLVRVRYDTGTYTGGEYVGPTGTSVLTLLSTPDGAEQEKLVNQFKSAKKKYETDGPTLNQKLISPSDISSKETSSLKADFRSKIEKIMATLKAEGYNTRIVFAWRNISVQAKKYRGGESQTLWSDHMHVDANGEPAANAVDLVWRKKGYSQDLENIQFMRRLGELAQAEGLTWGGQSSWAGDDIDKPKNAWRKNPEDGGDVLGFDPLHVEGPNDPGSMARATRATGVDISEVIKELKKSDSTTVANALQVVDPTLA